MELFDLEAWQFTFLCYVEPQLSELLTEKIIMPHELPSLPYDKAALEPHIDALTMEIHHGRHHKAYVDNLNKAIAGNAALEAKSLEQIIKDLASVPDAIRGPVRNNGGGHWNHSFFWKLMAPNAGGAPTGKLADDMFRQPPVLVVRPRRKLLGPTEGITLPTRVILDEHQIAQKIAEPLARFLRRRNHDSAIRHRARFDLNILEHLALVFGERVLAGRCRQAPLLPRRTSRIVARHDRLVAARVGARERPALLGIGARLRLGDHALDWVRQRRLRRRGRAEEHRGERDRVAEGSFCSHEKSWSILPKRNDGIDASCTERRD